MTPLVAGLLLAACFAPAVALGGDVPPSSTLDVVVDGDRISVRARDASLRSVLATLASRARLSLRIHGDADRPVTVSFEDLDLVAAVDRVVRGDYVLADDRLILFLRAPDAKPAAVPDTALPSVPNAPGPRLGAPEGPSPVADGDGDITSPVRAGLASDTPRAPAEVASPVSPERAGARGGRRASIGRRSGGAVAVPELVDPVEAQRLAREVEARSAQSPPVETIDVTASEAALRRSLP